MKKTSPRIWIPAAIAVAILLLWRECSKKEAAAQVKEKPKVEGKTQGSSQQSPTVQVKSKTEEKAETEGETGTKPERKIGSAKSVQTAEKMEVPDDEHCSWKVEPGQLEPPAKRSRFHDFFISFYYEQFKKRDLKPDSGKKIMCALDPRDTESLRWMTEIGKMAQNQEIPPVFCTFNYDNIDHIVFEFFKKAKCNFPTSVTDSVGACNYFFDAGCKLPAVFYLWNGNIMNVFGGPAGKPYSAKNLKKACCAPYIPPSGSQPATRK